MLRAELGTKNSPVHLFFHNQTRTAFSTASAWDAVAVAPCCCDSKALPCPHIPILQWGEKHSHHFCNIPLRRKFKTNRNLMTDWKCKEELLKTKPYCTFTWQRNQSCQIQLFHFLLLLPAPSSSSCPLSSVHSPKPLNSEHSGSDGEEKQHNLMESK